MLPEETTIGNLFSTRFPILVPKYQRAFAWEKEELDDFINDICELYRHNSTENQKKHFFGGIVSIHIHQPGTNSGRKYEIVDGQQRLATFFIALHRVKSTLLDIANKAQQQNDTELNKKCLAFDKQMTEQQLVYGEVENGNYVQKPRVTLSKADQYFFQQTINNNNPSLSRESHKRIKYAHDTIAQKLIAPILNLQNSSLLDKLHKILLLKNCLTDYCYVIHIFSEDKTEAYRLFSVLNDRGMTLSDGDLLRSRTLELLEMFSIQQNQAVSFWDQILAGKTSNVDKFLRSYYASNIGQKPPRRDLYDKFKISFFDYPEVITNDQADQVLKKIECLNNELEIFNNIADGEWPYFSDINQHVTRWDRERLKIVSNVFRHTLCFPLLLSSSVYLDETIFSNIVNLIEIFAFRYILIMGVHPGSLEEIYNRYAKNIRENPYNFNLIDLKAELRQLITTYAPDQVFEQQLIIELDYRQSSKKKLIRYFLTVLESYSQWYENGSIRTPIPDKMIAFNFDQTTIEHIYPRNAQAQFIDADLESMKNTVGNLSIWPPNENERAGNLPFGQKITAYENSSVRLNRWLSVYSQWTLQEYSNRQQRLLDMAKKIFQF